MTIEELCRRSYAVAVAKGWHEQKRTFGEATSLFHSEVSEALECYRDPGHQLGDIWHSEDGKPEGIVIELADLLIRIGDTVVDMDIPLFRDCMRPDIEVSELGAPYGCEEEKKLGIPDLLARIHADLSDAFKSSEDGSKIFGLGYAIDDAGILCLSREWDLERAVILKMEYNETRAHRHGGKRA
jgi:hypothetical protein